MVQLTRSTKPLSSTQIVRHWHLIDVDGKVLGRIAQEIATILQGKRKVNYVPYLDIGDTVVVINAKKIEVTGRKGDNKLYTRYSGYPSGLRTDTFNELMAKRPEEVLRRAVSGMLPKNKHRDQRLARLFIFDDSRHPYENQFKNNQK